MQYITTNNINMSRGAGWAGKDHVFHGVREEGEKLATCIEFGGGGACVRTKRVMKRTAGKHQSTTNNPSTRMLEWTVSTVAR
jgi:hypothetical protein